jgi:hypothetical protein
VQVSEAFDGFFFKRPELAAAEHAGTRNGFPHARLRQQSGCAHDGSALCFAKPIGDLESPLAE